MCWRAVKHKSNQAKKFSYEAETDNGPLKKHEWLLLSKPNNTNQIRQHMRGLISMSFCWRLYYSFISSESKPNIPLMSLVTRKPVFGVCDQGRLKPACAATEARQRLEISDIETRGITLSRQRTTKTTVERRWSDCADGQADLRF